MVARLGFFFLARLQQSEVASSLPLETHLLISRASLADINQCMEEAIASEMQPLREEVQGLREQVRTNRRVVSHKEATAYFDEDVSPSTILEYIKFRGLPAHKNGRKWFVYVEDLMDWQIGRIGWAKSSKTEQAISPRHKIKDRSKQVSFSKRTPA